MGWLGKNWKTGEELEDGGRWWKNWKMVEELEEVEDLEELEVRAIEL
jgi:hypothetical protein